MTTKAANPNYLPPIGEEVRKAIDKVGTGLWDKDRSTMWWGNWSPDPDYLVLIRKLGMTVGQDAPISDVFTRAEIDALKRSHGSANVNWKRAAAVKKAIGEGFDTISKLEERFKGTWKKTQISIDKAALVEAQSK